jgi:hypothetical protein
MNINNMGSDSIRRIMRAITQLMQGEMNRSPYARCGSIHSSYCQHSTEGFLIWHRLYIDFFENLIREADRELGNDGNISLPFWNFLEDLPETFLNVFSSLPDELLSRNIRFSPRHSVNSWRRRIESSGLRSRLNRVLQTNNVNVTFNNGWVREDLESVHNLTHVFFGNPMSRISTASFDPIFYLYHCGIDMIFQSWLENPLTREAGERYLERMSNSNFPPFRNNNDLSTRRYSQLISPHNDLISQEECFVVIKEIDRTSKEFTNNSYTFICLCFDNESSKNNFDYNNKSIDDLLDNKNFSGTSCLFGSRESKCKNCEKVGTTNIVINVTHYLSRHNLSRFECFFKILYLNMNENKIGDIEDSNIFNNFNIYGSISDMNGKQLSITNNYNNDNEVLNIQKYLKILGMYKDKNDGLLGENTNNSIIRFQKYFNIEQDGIIGNITKKNLNKKRFDNKPDINTYNPIKLNKRDYNWSLSNCIFNEKKVIKIIENCFQEWNKVIDLNFNYVKSSKNSDLTISFGRIDGINNTIATAHNNEIILDEDDEWSMGENIENKYDLQSTILHEIGHFLGIKHINDPNCVMYAYYKYCPTITDENVKSLKNVFIQ